MAAGLFANGTASLADHVPIPHTQAQRGAVKQQQQSTQRQPSRATCTAESSTQVADTVAGTDQLIIADDKAASDAPDNGPSSADGQAAVGGDHCADTPEAPVSLPDSAASVMLGSALLAVAVLHSQQLRNPKVWSR